MNDAKKIPAVLNFFQTHCTSRTYFYKLRKATILIVYNIYHCVEIALSMFILIECLLKVTVCCITNLDSIYRKNFCRQLWRMLRNLLIMNSSYQLHTNCEKYRICNYMCRVQQITSTALKKQNQERRFKGSETDYVKIYIHVRIFYSWVPGYRKLQRQMILKLTPCKRNYFLFVQD